MHGEKLPLRRQFVLKYIQQHARIQTAWVAVIVASSLLLQSRLALLLRILLLQRFTNFAHEFETETRYPS